MDVEKTIREYMGSVLHMSLGTCVKGKPWVCEVHFVFDDELNLYWRSKPSRRHSQEIAQYPNVAGNIVEPHGPTTKPRGVYFEGSAELLSGITEASPEYQLFVDRLGLGPEIVADAAAEDGNKFYKATVADWYIFDTREFPGKHHWER